MQIIRTLALSGAAAVALLGTAGTAIAADTETAAVVNVQEAVAHATGAPVALPDGRTIRVTGLESAGYRANSDHHGAVVRVAAHTDGDPVSPGQGNQEGDSGDTVVPDGQQPQQQAPNGLQQQQAPYGQQTGYNPNVGTAASGGGALAGTAVAALVLLIFTYFAVQKGGLSKGHMFLCVALGVLLAPTFVGPLVSQITGSGVQTFGNLWSGM